MANITKIKIDGVEHQIGYGAELDWKLVASGNIDEDRLGGDYVSINFETPIKKSNTVYVIRLYCPACEQFVTAFCSSFGHSTIVSVLESGSEDEVYSNVRLASWKEGEFGGFEINHTSFPSGNTTSIIYTKYEVYELVNKNVVNPSNVVEYQEKLIAGENITIENNVISASGGLHNQYCKITILDGQGGSADYKILLQTFKPITTLEEFRDYVRNTILPTPEADYSLHTLKIPLWENNYPDYLLFQNAYYGSASCSTSKYMGVTNEFSTITDSTDISVVIGRISQFEVLYDIVR